MDTKRNDFEDLTDFFKNKRIPKNKITIKRIIKFLYLKNKLSFFGK